MSQRRKNTESYLLNNLHFQMYQGKIWLNPEYQRGLVWTLSQKQLFIDSLLIDIDIPKLYFREIEKDNYKLEVVDGQQRLRTIFEFFQDGFRMPKDADDIEGLETRNRYFSELHTELQMQLQNTPLDIVVLRGYSEEDVEETFLRLQNGTPLNAAEKRRAIASNMRTVVNDLSKHKVYTLCSFEDRRFAYEDTTAKVIHSLLADSITDIKALSIQKTYEDYKDITAENPAVKRTKKAFDFIVKAFNGHPSPKFKKFSMVTLPCLAAELLEKYNISKFSSDFAESYMDFELSRRNNEELPEEKQNPSLAAYTDAARADSIQDLRYRHELLREEIIRNIPELTLKDPDRGFSEAQRAAIFWRDQGLCQSCNKTCGENEFHADHIVPHSNGGLTKIANGQVLCPTCNLRKGDKTW